MKLLAEGRDRLAAAGIANAAWEAEQLLVEPFGGHFASLYLAFENRPKPDLTESYRRMIERRIAHEPLQQIVGHWPFLELDLVVDRRALVPRPETEDLALHARTLLPDDRDTLAIDVGTGGGCLALALLSAKPRLRVIAIDLESDALALALENARRLDLDERIEWIHGDLLLSLPTGRRADLIVANLPYVSESEWEELTPDVKDYDPRSALVAADQGLAQIARLIEQAPRHLQRGAWISLEHAPRQVRQVSQLLDARGFTLIERHRDRFDRDRWITARWLST
jgi:release factor glutamine methyltransferase